MPQAWLLCFEGVIYVADKTPFLWLLEEQGVYPEETAPIAVVCTRGAVPLRAEVAHDAVVPKGLACLEFYVSTHRISRTLVPQRFVNIFVSALRGHNQLLLAARESEIGIHGRLCAIVPVRAFLTAQELSSIPPALRDYKILMPLGHVIRANEDRRYRDDLDQEALSLLGTLLVAEGQTIVERLLEDLPPL